MREPTLPRGRKKPATIVFFCLFALVGVFLIVESSLPGDVSRNQSNALGDFWASLVNFFNTKSEGSLVQANSLSLTADSSFLGEGEVAVGTTTSLTFTVGYPKKDAADVYDPSFSVERLDGSDESDYEILVSSSSPSSGSASMSSSVRIVGMKEGSYSIRASLGDDSDVEPVDYSFEVVSLPAPPDDCVSSTVDGTALEGAAIEIPVGEAKMIRSSYIDANDRVPSYHKRGLEGRGADKYMRRYYDITEAGADGTHSEVTIDEYGVLHGVSVTSSPIELSYYGQEFTVSVVSNPDLIEPDETSAITVTAVSDRGLYVNDMDYPSIEEGDVTTDPEGDENYGVKFVAEWSGTVPSDESVRFEIVDDDADGPSLKARIVDEGIDEEGRAYCFVQGYRSSGKIKVRAVSNMDPSISGSTEEIEVMPAEAESFSLLLSGSAISEGMVQKTLGDSIVISGSFTPENTADKNLIATVSDETVLKVSGSGTSVVTISTLKEGEASVTVTSESNPSLSETFLVKVSPRAAYDEGNMNLLYTKIRKGIGHFGAFMVFGCLGYLFLHFLISDPRKDYLAGLISLGISYLLAFITEVIQTFVPGRSGLFNGGGFVDMNIDSLGAAIGVLLAFLGFLIYYLILHAKKAKKAKSQKDQGG
jgi:VanZ family protein